MLARYAELGGGLAKLGDRPPERLWAHIAQAVARGDIDGVVGRYADDCVNVDHRELGWDEMRGPEQIEEFWRSVLAGTTDRHFEVDEVLACDDRVLAMRITFRGTGVDVAGALEIPMGTVFAVADGQCVRQDRYGHDDREAILARYAELTGRPATRSATAPSVSSPRPAPAGHAAIWTRCSSSPPRTGASPTTGGSPGRRCTTATAGGSCCRCPRARARTCTVAVDDVLAADERVIVTRLRPTSATAPTGGATIE